MTETPDWDLLAKYAQNGSDEAFSVLVSRHMDFVYNVCRREVGNNETAEDLTQAVFLMLAGKARTLTAHRPLTPWLYTVTRLAAKNTLRNESRLKKQEVTLAQNLTRSPSTSDWIHTFDAPVDPGRGCVHEADSRRRDIGRLSQLR